jgi:hypothetical protein
VVDPPHEEGADGVVGTVVNTLLHPPLAVVVRSHAENEALMTAWLWQAASVLSAAQLKLIAGVASTANVLVQVFVASQELV